MSKLATKDDLDALEKRVYRELASKDDLNNLETGLRSEIKAHMDAQFEEVYENMADMANVFQSEIQRIESKMATKDDIRKIYEVMATKDDINIIINMLDREAKRHEDYMAEQSAIKHQLSRHERWHYEAAKHSGYVLSTD